MNLRRRGDESGVPAALGGLILLPCAVPALWALIAFNERYRTCVQLENGANLGYEAVFDLSRPYLKPIAVPRLDDGTPIVRDRPWSIKIAPATIYGLSMASASDERGYRFAWRSDVGLVPGADNPSQYARRVAKAGHASAGANMRVAPAFVLLLVSAVSFQPKTGVRKLPISQWVS